MCALVAIVAVAACTAATAEPRADDEDVVAVFTPHRGPDADAILAVLDACTARPGVTTRHVRTAELAARLRERVRDGDAPAVAPIPQPSLVRELARDGQLVPPDDVIDAATQRYVRGTDVGVVDGRRVAVTFRIEAKSLVWYPPTTFRDAGLDPPATWRALLVLTDRMEATGTVPWCLGMEASGATGWMGTDWVEDLVLRMHGTQVYDGWTDGTLAFSTRPVATAFEQFGRIALTERWVPGGARAVLATPVEEALLPMLGRARGVPVPPRQVRPRRIRRRVRRARGATGRRCRGHPHRRLGPDGAVRSGRGRSGPASSTTSRGRSCRPCSVTSTPATSWSTADDPRTGVHRRTIRS
ncbi:MAG TPA: extracellular solute-binding protein [Euzebyales bacterium]|nr:extracellular solute-binding protein [Euzebyales bacterium]